MVDDNGWDFVRNITTWRRSLLLTNDGISGRCCHLALSCRNRSEGLVPELSLEFCATGEVYGLLFEFWIGITRLGGFGVAGIRRIDPCLWLMGFQRERLEELFLRTLNQGLAKRSKTTGLTASGLAGEKARSDAYPDQADAATQHA